MSEAMRGRGAQAALDRVHTRIRACARCPSMRGRTPVPGAGRPGAAVLFLAEAPGRLGAARTGVPLCGDRAGDRFWKMVAAVGLDPRDVYVTNAVKCNPLNAAGRNRPPVRAEVDACLGLWRAELALVGPRLLVPLGAVACRAATGLPLRAAVGRLAPGPGVAAFTLHHPAYVNRGGRSPGQYLDDWLAMRAALDALGGPRRGARSAAEKDAEGRRAGPGRLAGG